MEFWLCYYYQPLKLLLYYSVLIKIFDKNYDGKIDTEDENTGDDKNGHENDLGEHYKNTRNYYYDADYAEDVYSFNGMITIMIIIKMMTMVTMLILMMMTTGTRDDDDDDNEDGDDDDEEKEEV